MKENNHLFFFLLNPKLNWTDQSPPDQPITQTPKAIFFLNIFLFFFHFSLYGSGGSVLGAVALDGHVS